MTYVGSRCWPAVLLLRMLVRRWTLVLVRLRLRLRLVRKLRLIRRLRLGLLVGCLSLINPTVGITINLMDGIPGPTSSGVIRISGMRRIHIGKVMAADPVRGKKMRC